jgi:hypothetical protein
MTSPTTRITAPAPTELQALYVNTGPAVRPDLTRIPRGERPADSARLLLPALVALVGLALAGVLWWLLTLPGAKPHTLSAPPTTASGAGETPLTGNEDTGGVRAAPAAAAPLAPSQPSATTVSGETLTLKFSGASWVQIADAHGRVLLDGLQPPGGTRSVSGPAPLRVVLGNAPAVALQINGRPASLAGLVRRRGDARFSVDAAGTVSAAVPSAGHGD